MRDYSEELSLKKRKRRIRRFTLFFISIFILLVGGGAYLVLKTDYLIFQHVSVNGTEWLTAGDVVPDSARLYLWSGVHPENTLIASLVVHKNYFTRTLEVDIKEYEPYGIWCNPDRCFWFNADGRMITDAAETEGVLVKNVIDTSGRPLYLGDKILPDDMRDVMLNIIHVFDLTEIPVLRFELGALEKSEVTAVTESGTRVYFSLRFDPGFTVEPLKSLKEKLRTLEYIDFRSENKVFYK